MLIVDHVSLVYRRHRANVTCDRDLNAVYFARALRRSLERRREQGGGVPTPLPRWADLDERHTARAAREGHRAHPCVQQRRLDRRGARERGRSDRSSGRGHRRGRRIDRRHGRDRRVARGDLSSPGPRRRVGRTQSRRARRLRGADRAAGLRRRLDAGQARDPDGTHADSPELLFTITHFRHFQDGGSVEGIREDVLEGIHPGWLPSTLVARREAFDVVGEFDKSMPSGGDIDWFSRAVDLGVAMEVLPQMLLLKRAHNDSLMWTMGREEPLSLAPSLAHPQAGRGGRRVRVSVVIPVPQRLRATSPRRSRARALRPRRRTSSSSSTTARRTAAATSRTHSERPVSGRSRPAAALRATPARRRRTATRSRSSTPTTSGSDQAGGSRLPRSRRPVTSTACSARRRPPQCRQPRPHRRGARPGPMPRASATRCPAERPARPQDLVRSHRGLLVAVPRRRVHRLVRTCDRARPRFHDASRRLAEAANPPDEHRSRAPRHTRIHPDREGGAGPPAWSGAVNDWPSHAGAGAHAEGGARRRWRGFAPLVGMAEPRQS